MIVLFDHSQVLHKLQDKWPIVALGTQVIRCSSGILNRLCTDHRCIQHPPTITDLSKAGSFQ